MAARSPRPARMAPSRSGTPQRARRSSRIAARRRSGVYRDRPMGGRSPLARRIWPGDCRIVPSRCGTPPLARRSSPSTARQSTSGRCTGRRTANDLPPPAAMEPFRFGTWSVASQSSPSTPKTVRSSAQYGHRTAPRSPRAVRVARSTSGTLASSESWQSGCNKAATREAHHSRYHYANLGEQRRTKTDTQIHKSLAIAMLTDIDRHRQTQIDTDRHRQLDYLEKARVPRPLGMGMKGPNPCRFCTVQAE
jgi:hypothetical protein